MNNFYTIPTKKQRRRTGNNLEKRSGENNSNPKWRRTLPDGFQSQLRWTPSKQTQQIENIDEW